MPYEAAKCPNCGGELQLDNNLESGFCAHCGSKIIVRDAIQKMKIEVSGISSVENDLLRGEQCLAAKDWQSAFQFFCYAVDKDADRFEAWMGCLRAMTQEFTHIDYQWVKINGANGIEETIRNSFSYAEPEKKNKVIMKLKELNEIVVERIERRRKDHLSQCEENKLKHKQNKIKLIISLIALFISALFATVIDFYYFIEAGYLAIFSGIIAFYYLIKVLFSKVNSDMAYYSDNDDIKFLKRIRDLIDSLDANT